MFSLELATKESRTVVINFQCSVGEGVVSFFVCLDGTLTNLCQSLLSQSQFYWLTALCKNYHMTLSIKNWSGYEMATKDEQSEVKLER